MSTANSRTDPPPAPWRHHLQAGWIGVLVFASLGIGLEALHGFKASLYLDVSNGNRRLLWTLAHAHGTLLSLIQIAAAATIRLHPDLVRRARRLIVWGLMGGQVLIPAGFFLGGVWLVNGDPGPGIFLVVPGAGFLLAGIGAALMNLQGNKDPASAAGVSRKDATNQHSPK